MNPYRALLRRLGTKRWFAAFGRAVVTHIDRFFEKRSRSITTLGTGLPMGYLTTKGRHSGESRTAPLLYLNTTDGHATVVGTNFGGANHPGWAYNLEAHPRAQWKVGIDAYPVRARPATDLEYMALWPQFVELWPGYEAYVRRSGRQPKMFVLERRKS